MLAPLQPGGSAKRASRPRTGRFNTHGRGAKLAASLPRSPSWSLDRTSGIHVRPRRVTIKARVVKLAGKTAAAAAHLRYIERDGVARDGGSGRCYSTFTDAADGKEFLERSSSDRHQFRIIVAPEDGAAFESLRSVTRNLMAKVEEDLGTTLDWVAVDHFNTDHPHTHVLVRGITEDGKILNIAGDYIAHGIRHRASEIMTRMLGPQSELDVAREPDRQIDDERHALGRQLSRDLGMHYHEASDGEPVEGYYRRTVAAGSTRYALLENGHQFALVPWREDLERHVGHYVSGIVHGGEISWSLGRQRSGPEIGL